MNIKNNNNKPSYSLPQKVTTLKILLLACVSCISPLFQEVNTEKNNIILKNNPINNSMTKEINLQSHNELWYCKQSATDGRNMM